MCMYTYIHTNMPACRQTYKHAHIHIRIHTYTHLHGCWLYLQKSSEYPQKSHVIRKSALYIRKRSLNIRKRSLNIRKRALHSVGIGCGLLAERSKHKSVFHSCAQSSKYQIINNNKIINFMLIIQWYDTFNIFLNQLDICRIVGAWTLLLFLCIWWNPWYRLWMLHFSIYVHGNFKSIIQLNK